MRDENVQRNHFYMIRKMVGNGWKMVGKWLENCWKMLGKCLENAWKCLEMLGKCLENTWKIVGQWLENGWKDMPSYSVILTVYTNGLISGFPEIGALVPINLYKLIVRIRHPAILHCMEQYICTKQLDLHPSHFKGKYHWKQ